MNETELSLCARCAAMGHTCCQGTQIVLTLGDVRRIEAAGETGFYKYVEGTDRRKITDDVIDPLWHRIFIVGNRRRVLLHGAGDDCLFLTAGGCQLSLEARPLLCRLYPYEYNEAAIKGVSGCMCPRPEADNGPLLLALLGMNREVADEWRRTLYREIAEEYAR